MWDIRFPDAPQPFNEWFPAISFEEGYLTIQSYQFDAYLQNYSVPMGTEPVSIQLEFYDDAAGSLMNWLAEWVGTTMLNGGEAISPLEDCIKDVFITQLTLDKSDIVWSKLYHVYPEGGISERGSSDSNAKTLSATFMCVGGIIDTSQVAGYRSYLYGQTGQKG
jgi:hypothetical protein